MSNATMWLLLSSGLFQIVMGMAMDTGNFKSFLVFKLWPVTNGILCLAVVAIKSGLFK